ncbi:MAG: hypothetical protein WCJ13_12120 [Coriobacteriia bacterium]
MTDGTTLGSPGQRPEEEELARLRARLADLKVGLVDRELELATRRREPYPVPARGRHVFWGTRRGSSIAACI